MIGITGLTDRLRPDSVIDFAGIRSYAREANAAGVALGVPADDSAIQTPPPRPPALRAVARSACECHRDWIEQQVALGRNAQSLYQDLVERFAFAHHYNSVKRFVQKLKAREPVRFDVLDSLPGEEAQVDYGQGAPTRLPNGKDRRPNLFVRMPRR